MGASGVGTPDEAWRLQSRRWRGTRALDPPARRQHESPGRTYQRHSIAEAFDAARTDSLPVVRALVLAAAVAGAVPTQPGAPWPSMRHDHLNSGRSSIR